MGDITVIERLGSLFVEQTEAQADVARAIYRLLAISDAVSLQIIADYSEQPVAAVSEMVDNWPAIFKNDNGSIIGFWGLTGQEMQHRFIVDGRTRYTWCAWDALFIPELIDKAAQAQSTTAIKSRPVDLWVTPDQVQRNDQAKEQLFVSFNLPDEERWEESVLTTFCHHVHFLFSDETEEWLSANPDGKVLPLDKAFEAGHIKNARQFGLASSLAAE